MNFLANRTPHQTTAIKLQDHSDDYHQTNNIYTTNSSNRSLNSYSNMKNSRDQQFKKNYNTNFKVNAFASNQSSYSKFKNPQQYQMQLHPSNNLYDSKEAIETRESTTTSSVRKHNLRLPEDNYINPINSSQLKNVFQLPQSNKPHPFRHLLLSPSGSEERFYTFSGHGDNHQVQIDPPRNEQNYYSELVSQDNLLQQAQAKQQFLLQKIRQQQTKFQDQIFSPTYESFQTQQSQSQFMSQIKKSQQFEQNQINFQRNISRHYQNPQTNEPLQPQQYKSVPKNEKQFCSDSSQLKDLQLLSRKNNDNQQQGGNPSTTQSPSHLRHLFTFRCDPPHNFSTNTSICEDSLHYANEENKDQLKRTSRRQFHSFHQFQQPPLPIIKNRSNPHQDPEFDLQKERNLIKSTIIKGMHPKTQQQQQAYPQLTSDCGGTLHFVSSKVNSIKGSSSTANLFKKSIPVLGSSRSNSKFDGNEQAPNSNREIKTIDSIHSQMFKLNSSKLKTFLQRKPQENILNKIFQHQKDAKEDKQ